MNNGTNEIVICGLDGVLALMDHRLPYLQNEFGEPDWAGFHKACIHDMPNLPLIYRLNQAHQIGTRIVIISGRNVSTRQQTLQWLHQWQISYDDLWLSPSNSSQAIYKFKQNVLARNYPRQQVRRVYEFAQHIDTARDFNRKGIPCTLFGANQGNGAMRELFELKTIRHTCNHIMLYPFYGDDDHTWADRCAQLSENACLLCQANEMEAERAQQLAGIQSLAQERGLIPLEGSDRQVTWAENIRLTAYNSIDKVHEWMARVGPNIKDEDPDYWDMIERAIARAIIYLDNQTQARWWLDHRAAISNTLDSGRSLLNAVAEQEGYF